MPTNKSTGGRYKNIFAGFRKLHLVLINGAFKCQNYLVKISMRNLGLCAWMQARTWIQDKKDDFIC